MIISYKYTRVKDTLSKKNSGCYCIPTKPYKIEYKIGNVIRNKIKKRKEETNYGNKIKNSGFTESMFNCI